MPARGGAAPPPFGYDAELARYYPLFRRLRDEGGWNGLKFQMGVPTGLGLGFVIANPEDRMRYRGRSTRSSPAR